MSYIDIQYVHRVQSRLDRFQIKSLNPLQVNFRCPLCGDSKSSTTIARGWVLTFPNTSDHYYYCHNCTQEAMPFGAWLKVMDQNLFKEYIVELFKTNVGSRPVPKEEVVIPKSRVPIASSKPVDPLASVPSIETLDEFHPAARYISGRGIPKERWKDIYFVSKFKEFVNGVLPGKFEIKRDEGRIVIPLRGSDGVVFGVVGRAIDPKSLRYLTILFEETRAKIYGMDRINDKQRTWILEGAFDAMFVANSIAMAGLSVRNQGIDHLKDRVFVLDNQPRNKDVVRIMSGLISAGEKVVIWPDRIVGKDINEMLLSKELTTQEIVPLLEANTVAGTMAKLKLTTWKRTI